MRCREARHQLLKGDNTDTGRSHTWTQNTDELVTKDLTDVKTR